jgi:O-antigen ligase
MESRLLTAAMAVVALLLVAVSTQGTLGAAAAFAVALLVAALATLGRQRMIVVVFTGMFATAPMYRGIGGIGDVATPTDLMMMLGLFLLIPELINRPNRMPAGYVISLGVLLVTGMLGSLANPSPVVSVIFVLQWLLCIGVLPAALAMWYPPRAIVDGLLWSYLGGHMVSMVVALGEGPASNGRYDGLAHHPNDFGLAGGICVAIVLYLLHNYQSFRVKALLVAIAVASLVSVIYSGSRAVTLATAAVVVLVPLVERSGVWTFLSVAGGAVAIALLPYLVDVGGAGGSLARLGGDSTASVSDNLRETALADGWHRFLGAPFSGSGLDETVGTYHNVFLEVAVAVGVFGLLSYLIILYLLTRPLIGSHPLRRLSYLPWTFIVAGTTFPGIADRTVTVPMALAVMAAVAPTIAPMVAPAEEPIPAYPQPRSVH